MVERQRQECISIHALREEGDRRFRPQRTRSAYFYPRPPRGGRQKEHGFFHRYFSISIHALREEGDPRVDGAERHRRYFYPRPPRGGRRAPHGDPTAPQKFLSTPSARRATDQDGRIVGIDKISIHALREEGDCPAITVSATLPYFYPRPPRGGRLDSSSNVYGWVDISIHALREEGDLRPAPQPAYRSHFYPRPPRGGRRTNVEDAEIENEFLSTSSARRATAKTETKSLFLNKLYNILHEFRRALIYNGSKNYPNHAK